MGINVSADIAHGSGALYDASVLTEHLYENNIPVTSKF